ncbi:MAG: hypothetical protein HYS98_04665 [Deltaproteobacteria bacterium]|nr:hypothetical protein [Deltaproteobacteria bacterium]
MLQWIKAGYETYSLRIYLLLSLVLNIDSVLGIYRPIRFNDNFEEKWVIIKTSFADFLSSGLIAWNPTSITGNHALLFTLSPLNPFALLTQILPIWSIYSLWLLLHCFIAGIGLYLFLFNILKLSRLSSHISSFFFVIFIFPQLIPEHSFLCAFPLFLYCFHQCLRQVKKIKHILVILFLFIISSAPYTIVPFFFFHFLFIVCMESFKNLKRSFFAYAVLWFSYALMHAPTIYALLSELSFSNRVDFIDNFRLNFSFGIAFLKLTAEIVRNFPAAYIVPLSLSLLSLLCIREKWVRFGWGILIVTYSIVLIFNSSLGSPIISSFPFIKALYPTRFFLMIYHFMVCVLCAYGIQFVETAWKQNRQWVYKICAPVTILLVAGLFYLLLLRDYSWMAPTMARFKMYYYYQVFSVLFLTVLCIFIFPSLVKNKKFIVVTMGCILIWVLSLTRYEHWFSAMNKSFHYYFGDKNLKVLSEQEKNKSSFRVALNHGKNFSTGTVSPTLVEYHGFQTVDGVHPMYQKRFKEVWAQMVDPSFMQGYDAWLKDFSEWGVRVYLPYSVTNPSGFNIPLLSLLNVKYIVSNAGIDQFEKRGLSLYLPWQESSFVAGEGLLNGIKKYFQDDLNFAVYKINSVLPRSFVVPSSKVFDNKEDLLHELRNAMARDHLNSALFLKRDVAQASLPAAATSLEWTCEIKKYEPNTVEIEGFSSAPALLILTDNFHRNWKAWVNGSSIEIVPAYYTLRAVPVPTGKFVAEFRYEDKKLMIAYAMIPLGIVILLFFFPVVLLSNREDLASE